jgi:hypothetical protein
MKKKMKMAHCLALLCNVFGTIAAVYVGGWLMLLQPVYMLYTSFAGGTLTLPLVVSCAVKMLLSTTFAGLVWCIGYIGFNYFKGDEDPDWTALNGGLEQQELTGSEIR